MYKVQKTKFDGLFIINLDYKLDDRGYFVKNFNSDFFINNKFKFKIKEINISYNKLRGTLRGMHYQKTPFSETKIIHCISGEIYDVAIDLRKKSATYTKSFAYKLCEGDGKMIYIPKGFAHGYQTLKQKTIVQYFVDEKYNKKYEKRIKYNDPKFSIKWPLKISSISKKDMSLTGKQ